MYEANYLNILTALRQAHDNPNTRIGIYTRGAKDVNSLSDTIQQIVMDDKQISKSIKMMRRSYTITNDITFINGSYIRIASIAESDRAQRFHVVLYDGVIDEETEFHLKRRETLQYFK